MFKYVSDISELSHYIIKNFLTNKNIAIDATLGNGHDTDFLSDQFSSVYSFDIQKNACDRYKDKKISNVTVICDSHHKLDKYINSKVDCIMYNLGFLPGASKDITTLHETSLLSIKIGLKLLNSNGIMSICIYTGHDEGKKEKTCILDYLENLPKNEFGVMIHKYLNRSKTAPMLVIVEKK
ncbi:class I SAM-dependent methyltransferase [Clostridium sp.]|uniref:tRNA (mnm(5)s(2)U34)-methyltransferase n=1 Tax=Clostridium sp. TaxID=1506 RepID=UPI0026DBBFF1|nr:class I SAM-dependent methyltransferase [Clostridium sp.]MDO5039957.1 class I SAM-dependent methyltransferase [Clostridium sp.]